MAVLASVMVPRFAKAVEDLGLLGNKEGLSIKKVIEFQRPLRGDSRVAGL